MEPARLGHQMSLSLTSTGHDDGIDAISAADWRLALSLALPPLSFAH